MQTKILSILCFCMILSSYTVLAVDIGQPSYFGGDVKINGAKAPDNTLVTAKIDGVEVQAQFSVDGTFGHNPNIFWIADPQGNRDGKTVVFYVDNIKAGEFPFMSGHPTVANLGVSKQTTSPPNNPSSGGSGGGSGGGGSIVLPASEPEPELVPIAEVTTNTCTPEWRCSDWLDCINGEQKKICFDYNECDSEEGMPETLRSCKELDLKTEPAETLEESQGGFWDWLTGAAIGGGTTRGIVIPLLIVVLIGLGVWGYRSYYKRK